MFGTILKMRYTRWVAVLLIIATTITLNPMLPARASAQGELPKLKIAAVGIENLTKRDIIQDNHGMDMLIAELTDVEGLSVVPQEDVETNLRDLEPNPDVAISVGEAIGADAVMVGFVANLRFISAEQAEIEVGLSIYGVAEGNLLSEALVIGRATRLGFSGTQEQLAELAIRDGVRKATGFVFENMNHYGVVTMVKGNEVYTNMAERDNVRAGAEIAILRDNKQIASIEVKEVSLAHSSGIFIDQKKGISVKAGDKTRLVYTPAVYEQGGGVAKVPKKKKMNPVIIGLLAVGLVAAVSRGGSKAEQPSSPSGVQFLLSSETPPRAYVAYKYNANYLPAAPKKITSSQLSSSELGLCIAHNNDNVTTVFSNTAYDFKLKTSPKNPVFPDPMTIAFDMNGENVANTSKLKCATCNNDSEEPQWVTTPATYTNLDKLSGHRGVTCTATHFTPYIVIEDKGAASCPAPGNFRVQCGNGVVTLIWDSSTCGDPDTNIGYNIYECGPTSCPTVPKQFLDKTITTISFNVINDVQYCYAIEDVSNNSDQKADRTAIQCTKPSSDPEICKIQDITLVSPANNAKIESNTPTFIFIGSGTEDYYMLTVKDSETDNVMMDVKIDGEGSDGNGARQTFSKQYNGSDLSNNRIYKWAVTGYKNTRGQDLSSGSWYFTYVGGQTGGSCCSLKSSPTTLSPSNGVQIQDAGPTLIWSEVECAKYYILTIRNENGEQLIAHNKFEAGTNQFAYIGVDLVDNVTYYWNVTAYNGCGEVAPSNTARFTKVAQGVSAELPIPTWVGGGLDPVVEGDQLVSLRWYEEPDSKVIGYNIYRSLQANVTSSDRLDTIYKTQLSSPLPSANCPFQFSETAPGYCDISVTNGVKYYYKVSCIQQGDTPGNLSSVQSAQPPLQRAILMGPGDNTATDVTADKPTFMWFPVNGEDLTYILSLYKTETTGDTKIWEPSTKDTSIEYDGPTLEESKVYRWSVKSFSSKYGVQSEDSETHKFTKKAAVGKPDAPIWCTGAQCTGQSTFYAYSDTGIILYWKKPADNIKKFFLYRCKDTAGTCEGAVTAKISNTLCAGKTNSVCFEDANLDRGHDYYYSLVAVDSGETQSDPSDTPSKVTLYLKGPTLVTPVLGQVVYVPNPIFEWVKLAGATRYLVQVAKKSDNPTFSLPEKIIWSYSVDEDTTHVEYNENSSARGPLENKEPGDAGTEYVWRVCATNDLYPLVQADNCSQPRVFYKNLLPPTVISPAMGERVMSNEITFKWTSTPGAASYTMRVCKRVGTSTSTSCSVLPIIYQADTSDTSHKMTDVVLNNCDLVNDPTCSQSGTYYWDVRAYDAKGIPSGSWDAVDYTWARFYKVTREAPLLLIPTNGQVVDPYPGCGLGPDFYGNPTYNYQIMFAWTELPDAGSYRVRIESIEASADSTGATGTVQPHVVTVYEETIDSTSFNTNVNCGGGSSYIIPFSAGLKYRWNVTTKDNPYDTSNAKEFITGLPAPNLVAPTNNEMVMQDSSCGGGSMKLCVHFDWNGGIWENSVSGITEEIPGVIGASGYDIEINKCIAGGDCYPVHCEYDAQIPSADGKSTTFTNNSFCDLATTSVSNGETFKWRVRARDATGENTSTGKGIPGPWSQMYQFTVFIPPVKLAIPPDSSASCDPYNFPDTVMQNCTVVDCLDMYYSWSPQPHANSACYRIEISDTKDFRNLIWADNSPNTTVGGNINEFPCPYYQCYQADVGSKSIPMMNGVTYYWRVGSSVTAGANCGNSWVYSDVWEYFKRPPMPTDVTTSGVTENAVTLNWRPPKDCHANLSTPSQQISYPDVPPDTGGYIVYLEQSLPDASSPPTHIIGRVGYASANPSFPASNLSPDTDYYLCLVTVDGSGFETHPGHISNFQCAFTHTLPSTETSP